MQCRGIGPHLTVRQKSQCFSRVAAGTLGILSSSSGDDPSSSCFLSDVKTPV